MLAGDTCVTALKLHSRPEPLRATPLPPYPLLSLSLSSLHHSSPTKAAAVLKLMLALASRRGHAQVTPLHVAFALLASSCSLQQQQPVEEAPQCLARFDDADLLRLLPRWLTSSATLCGASASTAGSPPVPAARSAAPTSRPKPPTSTSNTLPRARASCLALMSMHTPVLVDSVGPPSAEVCRAAASFP
jgi:hypothetical protein